MKQEDESIGVMISYVQQQQDVDSLSHLELLRERVSPGSPDF